MSPQNHQLDAALVVDTKQIAGLTVRAHSLGSFILLRKFGNTLLDSAISGNSEAKELDPTDPSVMRDLSTLIFAHAAPEKTLEPYFMAGEGAASDFQNAAMLFCTKVSFSALGPIATFIFQTARAAGLADVEPIPEDAPETDPNSDGRSGRPSSSPQ